MKFWRKKLYSAALVVSLLAGSGMSIPALTNSVLEAFQAPAAPGTPFVRGALVESEAASATPCTDAMNAGKIIYVRQGATNGAATNWDNALTSLPSTLTRDRTYCVADTTTGFGAWTISSIATSTTFTKIVKATVADHGTSTGWSDTYGDGQAIFTSSGGQVFQITDADGYIEINGNRSPSQCGAIPGMAGTTQDCGFKFVSSATAPGCSVVTMQLNGGMDNSIVRSVELQGPGGGGTSTAQFSPTCTGDAQGLAAWSGGFANSTFQYSYVHNHVTQFGGVGDDSIVEHNFWANSRNATGAAHSNVAFIGGGTNGFTWRYNVAKNFDDEGFFLTYYNSMNCPCDVWIYGNIFDSPSTTNPRGIELRQGDSTSGLGYVRLNGIHAFNNSFLRMGNGITDRAEETSGGSPKGECNGTCEAINNLSYQAGNGCGQPGPCSMTYTTNTDDSTNRFVSVGSNYHLTGALAGTSGLPSPYNTDLFGNVRGADGTWDRGALEYCSGGCALTLNDFFPAYKPRGLLAVLMRNLPWSDREGDVLRVSVGMGRRSVGRRGHEDRQEYCEGESHVTPPKGSDHSRFFLARQCPSRSLPLGRHLAGEA